MDETIVERVEVSAYEIPTDGPESDGTLKWEKTTLVLVEAHGGGKVGLGYTYASRSTAALIHDMLAPLVAGQPLAVPTLWRRMLHEVRNLGHIGLSAMAVSAVDVALWDLQARLFDRPLYQLLGPVRSGIPVYGSGGFTSYSLDRLQQQLGGWAADGLGAVKMKVGRQPEADPERVRKAREAIGPDVELWVDANGAYGRKQALSLALAFAGEGVSWFEEPVPSDDLEGLRLIRDRGPAGMDIAAGEYGFGLFAFRRLLQAGAVDVLQADATRCGGITGFLQVAPLCDAFAIPFSSHTAPAIHLPACMAANCEFTRLEWFYDHVRIEEIFFDGVRMPERGVLHPDPTRPGLGLELKRPDIERYRR